MRHRSHLARLFAARDPLGATTQLARYFDGELDALAKFPVDPAGTPFQRRVWAMLRTIPIGATWPCAGLAARLDVTGAARAAGLANASNPIALVIPCSRVIGADGSVTAYGGGLERKLWLLEHEAAGSGCAADRRSLLGHGCAFAGGIGSTGSARAVAG